MQDIISLKYPIGPFEMPEDFSEEKINKWIKVIKKLPEKLKYETIFLTEKELDTPYRPEGWTVRQVVHHLADSHLNAYIRFKLALAEENPTIKPYNENVWAEMSDNEMDIEASLILLEGLHTKWAGLLETLKPEDFKRTFYHPESEKKWALKESLAHYAWHSKHHLNHIKALKKRNFDNN